jgi:hypothetical protein
MVQMAGGWKSFEVIFLSPFHALRMRLSVPIGCHVLRVFVAAAEPRHGLPLWRFADL